MYGFGRESRPAARLPHCHLHCLLVHPPSPSFNPFFRAIRFEREFVSRANRGFERWRKGVVERFGTKGSSWKRQREREDFEGWLERKDNTIEGNALDRVSRLLDPWRANEDLRRYAPGYILGYVATNVLFARIRGETVRYFESLRFTTSFDKENLLPGIREPSRFARFNKFQKGFVDFWFVINLKLCHG